MDELDAFISVLNVECEVLKKSGVMLKSVDEPWRYYSVPLDDELGTWCALAKAQQALLMSLSAECKAKAKKLGQSKGGQSKNEGLSVLSNILYC